MQLVTEDERKYNNKTLKKSFQNGRVVHSTPYTNVFFFRSYYFYVLFYNLPPLYFHHLTNRQSLLEDTSHQTSLKLANFWLTISDCVCQVF